MFGTVAVVSLLVLFLVMIDFPKVEPYLYPVHLLKKKPEKISEYVWIGGYMGDKELIEFLKKNNIKVVISLLSDTMIHEKKLLRKEKRFLERKGIKFYSVPMNPFLKEGRKVRRLRQLLRKRRKVYIHSYLGRIRTRIVKEVLGVK